MISSKLENVTSVQPKAGKQQETFMVKGWGNKPVWGQNNARLICLNYSNLLNWIGFSVLSAHDPRAYDDHWSIFYL